MPPITNDITGVILVGGKSRRMGKDKAFLELGGRTLFEGVLECFRDSFRRIILIGNCAERYERFKLPVYRDLVSGSALGGLYTGLFHANTDRVFVSSCDLPFPSRRAVRHLCSLTGEGDAVVPRLRHGYEPLFAAYSKRCLGPASAMLREGRHRISDLYRYVHLRDVSEGELQRAGVGVEAFMNVNTPQEYEAASSRRHVERGQAQAW